MADIELVIKIPEKTVNEIKDNAMFILTAYLPTKS